MNGSRTAGFWCRGWGRRTTGLLTAGILVLLASHLAALGAQAQTSVATPTIDPMGGNHTDLVIVTIETETPGAEIRYSFDPLSPESSWTVYSGPLELTPDENPQTIRTRAYLGVEASGLAQTSFNVFDGSLTGEVEPPDITPAGGTYFNPVMVIVDGHTSPPFKIRQVHITTDGQEPRPHSNTGGGVSSPGSLMISESTTVKALATQLGWRNSDVVTRMYVLQCAAPQIMASEPINEQRIVTISTATADAEIRYTTDGSDPTESSTLYTMPFTVAPTVFDVTARCFRTGFEPSEIVTLEVNERPPPKFCMGSEVTVDLNASPPGVPTEGADVILGTDNADIILALGGDDIICANGGDDDVNGGDGNDSIAGGDGNDTITGGPGDDGNDTITGGSGNDNIDGREGDDIIAGGTGDDFVIGGEGNDIITLGEGNDIAGGNGGLDTIDGGPGDDTLIGGDGNDTIEGGDGMDTINGGLGADKLVGGDGNDVVDGQEGNDVLRGGAGFDQVVGGDGNDRVLGGIDNDVMNGGAGDDYLGGFGGADTINGGPGDDIIFGGFGPDTIDAGPGDDEVFGLVGNDTIDGGDGNDSLNGDRGNDTINGGNDDDIIRGGNADDVLSGNDGDDSVSGGKADDMLFGNRGVDTCVGNLEHTADTADSSCEIVRGVP